MEYPVMFYLAMFLSAAAWWGCVCRLGGMSFRTHVVLPQIGYMVMAAAACGCAAMAYYKPEFSALAFLVDLAICLHLGTTWVGGWHPMHLAMDADHKA
jgi:hypothetical protein